jgi:hypothetical protein
VIVIAELCCHAKAVKTIKLFYGVNNCNELYQYSIVQLPGHLFHWLSQHDVDAVINQGTQKIDRRKTGYNFLREIQWKD